MPGPYDLQKNTQLLLLDYIGKVYTISFEIFVTRFGSDEYQSVLHFTVGGNAEKYGDRTPGVWVRHDGALTVSSAINGYTNMYHDFCCLTAQKWTTVKISQTLQGEKVWRINY